MGEPMIRFAYKSNKNTDTTSCQTAFLSDKTSQSARQDED
jgi:hypothetical protein